MKLTLKLFLIVWLFSSVGFAVGDMNNGSRACAQNCYAGEQPEILQKTRLPLIQINQHRTILF